MAKPKHGRCGPISLFSSPDAHRADPHPVRSRLHSPSSHFPSSAVLSALAVIATVPCTVSGSPLPLPTPPPTFLCPLIERNLRTLPLRATILAPPPTLTHTPQHVRRQPVADKYVQGSDSLWRKTDSWILYGSTCCSTSTASTSAVQSQPGSSQTPLPTPITAQFDTSALPAGWNDAKNLNSSTESTIILALAIVLASLICIFMIACVIWRRRKRKAKDIERKLAHKLAGDNDSQDNVREKDAQGKMLTWARASARWKSNIRQSARRRRKRAVVTSIVNRSLSPTFSDSPQVSVIAPPDPSRRDSFVSQEPGPSDPDVVSCLNGNLTEPASPLRSPSPPTYGASFIPGFSRPPPTSAVPNLALAPSPDSPHAVRPSNLPSLVEDEPLPYAPPSDGHVATDDKARLAHIHELASAPPATIDAANASTAQVVSAPEWHEVDDDLEDLDIDLGEVPVSLHSFGFPPSFPPPPSKADVPFGYLDDCLLRHGEGDDTSLPASGWSGPSLGASPSAPPIDDPGLEPSAPSLEGEDDLFQDWDGASSDVPETPTLADLDSPTCTIKSPISTSHTSLPSIQESAPMDGIPPRYHP